MLPVIRIHRPHNDRIGGRCCSFVIDPAAHGAHQIYFIAGYLLADSLCGLVYLLLVFGVGAGVVVYGVGVDVDTDLIAMGYGIGQGVAAGNTVAHNEKRSVEAVLLKLVHNTLGLLIIIVLWAVIKGQRDPFFRLDYGRQVAA